MSTQSENILKSLNPEQLIRAYLKAKVPDLVNVPDYLINKAAGDIEEALIVLGVEPYSENDGKVNI